MVKGTVRLLVYIHHFKSFKLVKKTSARNDATQCTFVKEASIAIWNDLVKQVY